eukprot:m.215478 g.215478  ORF g.215478 m.215478 type:complete len:279 (+) comp19098_c0_seq2:409-1245(+)
MPASGTPGGVSAPTGTIYAFDFDGVICDSATETARTGLIGLKILFERKQRQFLFADADTDVAITAFSTARPCLETGWEAIPMMHLLLQGKTGNDLLDNFQTKFKQCTIETALESTSDILKEIFSTARTSQIESNRDKWLASHGFYHDAVDAVKDLVSSGSLVYIITTKAKDFTMLLLAAASLDIPEERIFGLGSGPKPQVLADILACHASTHSTCVFVEDRVKTLLAVQSPGFASVAAKTALVLAAWGYNTAADHRIATAHGIHVVNVAGLRALCAAS